jgi:phosphonate transport system ATP-binding protein
MIFQHYNLIDRSNVFQNVLHGRLGYMSDLASILNLYSREDRVQAYKMLERVGLESEIYKRADQLSGGQKQRVGISRALLQKPDIVLADEPIASLDPATAETVMDYLHDICREDGIAAVVSLHQVEFAFKYASRIIGLRRGEIVYDGSPDDLSREMIDNIYDRERDLHPVSVLGTAEAVPC